jgi:hypothetical protein
VVIHWYLCTENTDLAKHRLDLNVVVVLLHTMCNGHVVIPHYRYNVYFSMTWFVGPSL